MCERECECVFGSLCSVLSSGGCLGSMDTLVCVRVVCVCEREYVRVCVFMCLVLYRLEGG